jgi:hypothetical protein
MKPKHDPLCLYQVSVCDCGAREKLMPAYIKRKKKILKRMVKDGGTGNPIYIDNQGKCDNGIRFENV